MVTDATWDRTKTGHWQRTVGGVLRALVRRGGSGRFYVEIPAEHGGMYYPQRDFATLQEAQTFAANIANTTRES